MQNEQQQQNDQQQNEQARLKYLAAVLASIPLECNAELPKHIKLQELVAMFRHLNNAAQANCRSSQLALELIIRHAKITDSVQKQYENFM